MVALRPCAGLQAYTGVAALVVVFSWAWAAPHPNTPPLVETVGGVVFPVMTIVSFLIQNCPPAEAVIVRI